MYDSTDVDRVRAVETNVSRVTQVRDYCAVDITVL